MHLHDSFDLALIAEHANPTKIARCFPWKHIWPGILSSCSGDSSHQFGKRRLAACIELSGTARRSYSPRRPGINMATCAKRSSVFHNADEQRINLEKFNGVRGGVSDGPLSMVVF